MEPWLWTAEQLIRFSGHEMRDIRRWAQGTLAHLYPEQAGPVMVDLLDDRDEVIRVGAIDFLGETGDAERYGLPLLERLRDEEYGNRGQAAQALAMLGVREALPILLEQVRKPVAELEGEMPRQFALALAVFGGQEARDALWHLLDTALGSVIYEEALSALLRIAVPQDIDALARRYRDLPPNSPDWPAILRTLAAAVDAATLVDLLVDIEQSSLDALLHAASDSLGRTVQIPGQVRHALHQAYRQDYRQVFDVLVDGVNRLVQERQDDVDGWLARWEAGELPQGYRRRLLLTMRLFRELAAFPSGSRKQRRYEAAWGVALLTALSVDQDDLGRLEAAAKNGPVALQETALSILGDSRENVLPDIEERVVALGPDVVPFLRVMLDPHDNSWGTVRVVETITGMARRYPGSCDDLVPGLIEALNEDQGDFVLEGSAAALSAIGRPAVPLIEAHLRDESDVRWIYLCEVLGDTPVESAAQALLHAYAGEELANDLVLETLADIGSPSAIEPVYALWKQRDEERTTWGEMALTRTLYILCELNAVAKPELSIWRKQVESRAEAFTQMMENTNLEALARLIQFGPGQANSGQLGAGAFAKKEPETAAPADVEPSAPSHSKKSGPSKKERKRRQAQSRKQRRK